MQVNSRRTLVFALILALVAGPAMPVFAAYTEGITNDSLRHSTAISYDRVAVQNDQCLDEHSLCDEQCCAPCANCLAVNLADLPTTPHYAAIPGSTVSLLKPSLATASHTGPPRIRA